MYGTEYEAVLSKANKTACEAMPGQKKLRTMSTEDVQAIKDEIEGNKKLQV